ncbi:hypothetical protein HDU92_006829 [Lobulomyces angularis]|nr:hypothetical protein HDU92_006829 [Lobulomyces angularis]
METFYKDIVFELVALAILTFFTVYGIFNFSKSKKNGYILLPTQEEPQQQLGNSERDDEERQMSPETNATLFQKLTFRFIQPLLNLGNKKTIDDADLWDLTKCDLSTEILAKFQAYDKKITIFRRLIKLTWVNLSFQAFGALVNTFLGFGDYFFLKKIVSCIQNPEDTFFNAYFYLAMMFIQGNVKTVSDGQMLHTGRRIGMHFRSVLMNEIYEKALKREVISENKEEDGDNYFNRATHGKIVTLMSVDVEGIRSFVSGLHDNFIRLPLAIIIAFVSLLLVMGASAFGALFTLLLFGPLTSYLGRLLKSLQSKLMQQTDSRISSTNECLQGIRIVKYFAWEQQFIDKIIKIRNSELKYQFNIWLVWAAFSLLSNGGGMLVSFVTFYIYTVVQGQVLDPATAFTALLLLRRLSDELTRVPEEIGWVLQIKVSFERIFSFLNEPELAKYSINLEEEQETLNPKIGFKNGIFSYNKKLENEFNLIDLQDNTEAVETINKNFILNTFDLEFPVGKLSIVIGPTGSGKSSLLLALLGEMTSITGGSFLPDERRIEKSTKSPLISSGVSYVAQTSWLLNATVRDNILFGLPFDQERYNFVIEACSLNKDLANLKAGDLTEIGEKGVNLSGGQKQRISLARAAYSPSSIVLLDDPLSAVDAPTSRHLLYNCICSPLMSKRTIILVTHAISLVLPKADFVVVLKNGSVIGSGPQENVSTLLNLSGDLTINEEDEINETTLTESGSSVRSTSSEENRISEEEAALEVANNKLGKLVTIEEKQNGSVRFHVYLHYFKAAGGVPFVATFFFSFILIFISQLLFSWWIKNWSEAGSKGDKDVDFTHYLKFFALFAFFVMFSTNFKFLLQLKGYP